MNISILSLKFGGPRSFRRSRWIAACVGVLLLGGFPLLAQERLNVTALSGWQGRGGTATVDSAGGVTVPAGAALSRSVTGDEISVRAVSRPYFGVDAASSSTLEVGPASLTFVRDATRGAMVLLGDQALVLPFPIVLDGDGRSQQALDFTLGYSRTASEATLAIEGRTFNMAAIAPAGAIQVAVDAGTAVPWSLHILATTETSPSNSSPGVRGSDAVDPSIQTGKTPFIQIVENPVRAMVNARARALEGDIEGAIEALTESNVFEKRTARWHLETGRKLSRLAFDLIQVGKVSTADLIAREALEQLELVREKADKQSGLAASSWTLTGFLHERYWGDDATAKTSYEQAVKLAPEQSDLSAKLRRFDKSPKAEASKQSSTGS